MLDEPAVATKRHCAKLDEMLRGRIRTCALRGRDIHADPEVQALMQAIAAIQREAARDKQLSKMLQLIGGSDVER